MIGAFAYLVLHSARNQVASRLKRLRNPRYAIALVLGLAYFWFVFFNRSARAGRASASPMAGETVGALAPIGLLLYAAYLWIVGADTSALAFTNAEVSMLFTAPVSRRQLILYKLSRSQFAVLISSVLWVFLFGRGHDAVARAIGYWVLFSTLNLHRLGVALIHAAGGEHGARGLRRNWLPIAVFCTVAAVVAAALVGARGQFLDAGDAGDVVHALTATFSTGPASWVLYPFRIAVAPAVATSATAWARAVAPALLLLGLHVVWVLRTDSAFEEAAAEASALQARRIEAMRARRMDAGVISARAAKWTIPLRSTGAPEVALIWKNTLWLLRSGLLRTLVGLPALGIVLAVVFSRRSTSTAVFIAILSGMYCVMLIFFGPVAMRNDLRGDLRRLPMIKTLPLSGQQVIFAEVASSAAPIAFVQFLGALAAFVALSQAPEPPLTRGTRVAALLVAPVVLLGLNLAVFTIHNALALLLPGWVRLGEAGPGGIEAIGQAMLSSIITLVMLLLLLIGPAAGAVGVFFLFRHQPVLVAVLGGLLAGAVLGFEAYLLSEMLGGTLERTEPMHVG